MTKRVDKRPTVILAVVIATVALGYLGYRVSVEQTAAAPVAVDPHIGSAVELQRQDAALHQTFQQAVALLRAGEYEYAAQGFHEVLRIAPEMAEAHVNMGFALIGLEQFAAAMDFFDAAADLRPSQFNAYYGMAVAHEGLGDLRRAVSAMRTYVHLIREDDPYRPRAEAAIWEWEAELSAGDDSE